MSHTVSETAREPRLVVDRYANMDLVFISFILPPDVLTKGARGRDIAVEVQTYIAEKGLGEGQIFCTQRNTRSVDEEIVSEIAQRPRLIVDRYGNMDSVSINFILPAGVLKQTHGIGETALDIAKEVQAIGRDIAVEVQTLIADKGLPRGHVAHHRPNNLRGAHAQR